MNDKPVSVYAHEITALRDLTLMREGEEQMQARYPGCPASVFFIKEMRIDYTTPID